MGERPSNDGSFRSDFGRSRAIRSDIGSQLRGLVYYLVTCGSLGAITRRKCRGIDQVQNAEIGFAPSVAGSSTPGLLIRRSQVRALVGEPKSIGYAHSSADLGKIRGNIFSRTSRQVSINQEGTKQRAADS